MPPKWSAWKCVTRIASISSRAMPSAARPVDVVPPQSSRTLPARRAQQIRRLASPAGAEGVARADQDELAHAARLRRVRVRRDGSGRRRRRRRWPTQPAGTRSPSHTTARSRRAPRRRAPRRRRSQVGHSRAPGRTRTRIDVEIGERAAARSSRAGTRPAFRPAPSGRPRAASTTRADGIGATRELRRPPIVEVREHLARPAASRRLARTRHSPRCTRRSRLHPRGRSDHRCAGCVPSDRRRSYRTRARARRAAAGP